jgi:hypothetical protein
MVIRSASAYYIETLKAALVEAPILALSDFPKPFLVEIDAYDFGVGAILMQEGHPISFVRKALGPRLRGLSTYEKEYVDILLAIEQWRSYMQFQEFTIATDHKSLSHINKQRLHTQWQQKVFTKLLGLHYKIVYKKGVDNRVVGALSRLPTHELPEATCNTVTICHPKWIEDVEASYALDSYVQDVMAKLMIDVNALPHFSWAQGVLRYKSRI